MVAQAVAHPEEYICYNVLRPGFKPREEASQAVEQNCKCLSFYPSINHFPLNFTVSLRNLILKSFWKRWHPFNCERWALTLYQGNISELQQSLCCWVWLCLHFWNKTLYLKGAKCPWEWLPRKRGNYYVLLCSFSSLTAAHIHFLFEKTGHFGNHQHGGICQSWTAQYKEYVCWLKIKLIDLEAIELGGLSQGSEQER